MRNNIGWLENVCNLLLNVQIESFEILSEGCSLFHLIDYEELNCILLYSTQWVIGWCNLMEFYFIKV